MNNSDKFNQFSDEERAALESLTSLAGGVQPDPYFVTKTEAQLKERFAMNSKKPASRWGGLWRTFAGAAVWAVLALGMIWLVRSVAPEPARPAAAIPAATSAMVLTATPAPGVPVVPTPLLPQKVLTYQSRGVTIHLAATLPQEPGRAGLYTHSPEAPASKEVAQALAQRFGINGQVYRAAVDSPAVSELLVTDGKQRLYIFSAERYTYSSGDLPASSGAPVPLAEAALRIDSFLKAHGFDFKYQLQVAQGMGQGWFYVIPLNVDDRPVHFEYVPQALGVQVSPQGQVVMLDANLLAIDSTDVGQFDLISAEQAWQRYLNRDVTPLGILDYFHSVATGTPVTTWTRAYRAGVPISLYGHVDWVPALDASQPPFLTLDTYTLSGKTAGMENVEKSVLVQAKGQFVDVSGIRTFQVDEWQVLSQYGPAFLQDALQGSLRQAGQQVIFTADGTDYVLEDAPTDLPLPLTDVHVIGYLMEPKLEWQLITHYDGNEQFGGGGGGGGSFAKLNLSGTPVPWPVPQASADSSPSGPAVGDRLEQQRGSISIIFYEKADGSRRAEYGFTTKESFFLLQGDAQFLAGLQVYNNRPVNIWGVVSGYTDTQSPILTVERFDIPYPDADFQILRGTQKLTTLEGQPVALFTSEEGKTYAQLSPMGTPTDMLIGVEGDSVEFEVLIIPDERFGGLPAMRTFGGGLAVSPKTGQPSDMQITADQPGILTESTSDGVSDQPELTIDTIELVYFTNDPRYAASYPEVMSIYLQPVWRFFGHYSNGDEAEILIQALKPEYLLPEAAPSVPLG